MLVGSGRLFTRCATSVSPTWATIVGPGTEPSYPHAETRRPGEISHAVSRASRSTWISRGSRASGCEFEEEERLSGAVVMETSKLFDDLDPNCPRRSRLERKGYSAL